MTIDGIMFMGQPMAMVKMEDGTLQPIPISQIDGDAKPNREIVYDETTKRYRVIGEAGCGT